MKRSEHKSANPTLPSRVGGQLGYKMAKYVMRIEAVDDFSKIVLGKDGFWEDRGCEWCARI